MHACTFCILFWSAFKPIHHNWETAISLKQDKLIFLNGIFTQLKHILSCSAYMSYKEVQ